MEVLLLNLTCLITGKTKFECLPCIATFISLNVWDIITLFGTTFPISLCKMMKTTITTKKDFFGQET